LIDRIGAEVGDVAVDRRPRLLRCRHAAGLAAHHIGCHLHTHVTAWIVVDDPVRPGDRLAIDLGADVAPGAEQAFGPLAIRLVVCAHPVTEMYWVSRNSIRPSCAPSRPRPLCLVPPNGAAGSETRPRFKPIIPKSSCSETRMPRLMSLV